MPHCSCDALIRVRGYFQSEHIIRFLRGLNPGFAAVRSQILRSKPLPNINQVFSMASQEEQQMGVAGSSSLGNGAQAAAADLASSSHVLAAACPRFKQGTKRPLCSHSGLIGHTVEKCYRNIGFPPGYQRRRIAPVNAVQSVEQAAGSGGSGGSVQGDNTGGVTISQEQYRSLYSLFQGHGSAT
ncbi:hypothetical protein LINPERPRIM_LOCUS26322 [Linum perenne]